MFLRCFSLIHQDHSLRSRLGPPSPLGGEKVKYRCQHLDSDPQFPITDATFSTRASGAAQASRKRQISAFKPAAEPKYGHMASAMSPPVEVYAISLKSLPQRGESLSHNENPSRRRKFHIPPHSGSFMVSRCEKRGFAPEALGTTKFGPFNGTCRRTGYCLSGA